VSAFLSVNRAIREHWYNPPPPLNNINNYNNKL